MGVGPKTRRRCAAVVLARYRLLIGAAVNSVLVSPVRLGPGAGSHRLLLLPYLTVAVAVAGVASQHGSL